MYEIAGNQINLKDVIGVTEITQAARYEFDVLLNGNTLKIISNLRLELVDMRNDLIESVDIYQLHHNLKPIPILKS